MCPRSSVLCLVLLLGGVGWDCSAHFGRVERATPTVAVAIDRSREVRLLALGDSFTAGTGSRPEDAFPARLAARLTRAGVRMTVRNLGVNGYTTLDLIAYELPVAAAFHPTLVTLAIGANDIVQRGTEEEYRKRVRRILVELKAQVPPDHIVVLPQPDWPRSRAASLFDDPDVLEKKARAYDGILREEARAAGAAYLDLSALMRRQADDGLLAEDGLHPSKQAYDEWADALFRAIRR